MTSAAQARNANPLDTTLVLAGRPLRQGTDLATTARFADDQWRLQPAALQRHVGPLIVNFGRLPERYRSHGKQLIYAMIAGPLPQGEKQQGIRTIHSKLVGLQRFFTWLAVRPAADGVGTYPALCTLSADDLIHYEQHLHTLGLSAQGISNSRAAVGLLWRYRANLTDPLQVDLRNVTQWGRKPSSPAENITDRIPEQVLAPLLVWSLRFVDEFSHDIIAAVDHNHTYLRQLDASLIGSVDRAGVTTRLESYLAGLTHNRTPVPGYQLRPNMRFISAQILCRPCTLRQDPRWRSMIDAAAADVGVTEYTWLTTDVAATVDGEKWVEGIALRHPTRSLDRLLRLLQTACYVVIAYLSGMRDSESKHIRRRAVTVSRDAEGTAYRWHLSGVVFKGHADPAGTPTSWVVGEPAARAIDILQKLQPAGQQLLFAPLGSGVTPRSSAEVFTTAQTNEHLNEFARWVDQYCSTRALQGGIPTIAGQHFRLSTRQFRRTLAWYIARRPGGSIAGAIQYKHLGIQMFEGYAGTSGSGFRAEVESEQALTRGQQLLSMTTDNDHDIAAGPAATEARRRLDEFATQARYTGLVLTDPVRIRRFLRNHEPNIFPGTYSTCVFNPDKALCQPRNDAKDEPRPALGDCQPLECGNVALTADNITALNAELVHVETELKQRPALPPLLQHRLGARHDEIERLLNHQRPESR
ncbi:hypothetical protein [Kribbella catacumbae]|uniref:hypothetical protein n=1 Tax=Kribbella catacumbae TaxID=460086 RepID=UPI0003786E71|nr:hypothetical protein [Kribbella catacumbae]